MFTLTSVTKQYGSFRANDDISLTVQDGQIAVLVGPNGAGKSTLIKCMAGLLRHRGQITIDGYDNRSLEAKARLGYIPEIPAPYELLTVWEHLCFIARAYRLERGWEVRGRALLERLELLDKKDKLGKELSKGMRQKLSIACALLPQPKAVIFDEPLVGLDPHAIKELKEMMVELKQSGASVLISTHMLDSVEQLWDEAFILMNGRIAASLRRQDESGAEKSLEELFFRITEGERAGDLA